MKTPRKRKATAGRKAGARKTTTRHMLQDNAGAALRRGRATLSRAYDWAHDATASASAPLHGLRLPRGRDISQLAEANPLLLGAVGLGLGVAIGTLFPHGMKRLAPARTAKAKSRSTAAGNGTTAAAKKPRRRARKAPSEQPVAN